MPVDRMRIGPGIGIGFQVGYLGSATGFPANIAPPVLGGTAYVGQTMTVADLGNWTGGGLSYTFQWKRNGVDIGGAVNSSYLVTLADEGVPIRCQVTATNSFGSLAAQSNTIELWVPSDITVLSRYDAADPSSITQVAGAVSQWDSKVGVSHMLQAVGAKQPLTGVASINGLNALRFDGSGDAMDTAVNPFGASISDAMVLAAINIRTISASTLFSLTGTGTNANRWQSHCPYSGGTIYFDCGGTGGANRLNAASGWASNQNHFVAFYCSVIDSVQEIYTDGSLLIGDATGHTVNTVKGVTLGHDGSGAYDSVDIGEFIVINGTVTTTNRQKAEGYLAWRWGLVANLPGGHPYKTAPPVP